MPHHRVFVVTLLRNPHPGNLYHRGVLARLITAWVLEQRKKKTGLEGSGVEKKAGSRVARYEPGSGPRIMQY